MTDETGDPTGGSSDNPRGGVADEIKKGLPSIPATIKQIITDPVEFYKQMPKSGGFVTPLVFMVLMGVAGGVVQAVLGIIGLSPAGSVFSIIFIPAFVAIFGFVGAAILFIIWKLMGSQESYETAYRCGAYAGAIVPVTTLLSPIPYLGPIIGIVWTTYLLVVASMEVHSLPSKLAWTVFGALCVFFSIVFLSTNYAGRQMTKNMDSWQKGMERKMGDMEEMTPEEAGKALGDFMKGLKESQKNK